MTPLAIGLTGRFGPFEPPALCQQVVELEAGVVPLVLLHAYPFDSTMFTALTGVMTSVPIVLIDLPGQGQSPICAQATVEAAADLVAQSLRRLGVNQAVVAGVSMGGYVTMALMRHHPELLAGVVLMHTKAEADATAARQSRLAVARRVTEENSVASLVPLADQMVSTTTASQHPDRLAQVRAWIGAANPPGVAWAQTAMAARPDSFGTLRRWGLPATVVSGAEDPLVPTSAAEAMVEALGVQAKLVVVSDVAHLSPVEAPDLAAGLLREAYRQMN
ncbi:MAG: alpha/beta hydrolase [Micrococcales bacterium]|nr:alpha/beta hydrolase [Micrococcales bacterium]